MKYQHIEYNKQKFTVCEIQFKPTDNLIQNKLFIINTEDFDKIKDREWHYNAGGYISSTQYDNNKKKELYLHNLIMNKLTFDGKGQLESIDHNNRIGLDNRKQNLHLITQSEQNLNQKKKTRKNIILPDDCGITAEEIPKTVWLQKAQGAHGSRFVVEIKGFDLTVNYETKSTSSKNKSLRYKLEEIKKKLQLIKQKFGDKFNNLNIEYIFSEKCIDLMKDYNEIIKLSTFESVNQNIVIIPERKNYLTINKGKLVDKEFDEINNLTINDITIRESNK